MSIPCVIGLKERNIHNLDNENNWFLDTLQGEVSFLPLFMSL